MNVELLQKVYDRITKHSSQYDQTTFGEVPKEFDPSHEYEPYLPEKHTCKTTACVAGWAVILDGKDELEIGRTGFLFIKREGKPRLIGSVARERLRISEELAHFLFNAQVNEFTMHSVLRLLIQTQDEESAIDMLMNEDE